MLDGVVLDFWRAMRAGMLQNLYNFGYCPLNSVISRSPIGIVRCLLCLVFHFPGLGERLIFLVVVWFWDFLWSVRFLYCLLHNFPLLNMDLSVFGTFNRPA